MKTRPGTKGMLCPFCSAEFVASGQTCPRCGTSIPLLARRGHRSAMAPDGHVSSAFIDRQYHGGHYRDAR